MNESLKDMNGIFYVMNSIWSSAWSKEKNLYNNTLFYFVFAKLQHNLQVSTCIST